MWSRAQYSNVARTFTQSRPVPNITLPVMDQEAFPDMLSRLYVMRRTDGPVVPLRSCRTRGRGEVDHGAWAFDFTLPLWATPCGTGDLQYQRIGPPFCSTSEGCLGRRVARGMVVSGPAGWDACELRSYEDSRTAPM
jgi:hypothetical protein